MLHAVEVAITTNGSQVGENYSGAGVTGRVVGIKYEFGTLANTADFTITGETSSSKILAYANVPAADAFWYPRILPNKHTDGAAFTDAAAEAPYVFNERIKIETAQGGASKAGTMTFYVEDNTFA
jgi:hypothetical protein